MCRVDSTGAGELVLVKRASSPFLMSTVIDQELFGSVNDLFSGCLQCFELFLMKQEGILPVD